MTLSILCLWSLPKPFMNGFHFGITYVFKAEIICLQTLDWITVDDIMQGNIMYLGLPRQCSGKEFTCQWRRGK